MIADRYDYKGTQRTMEDIKDRYYTVVRKILMARTPIAMMTPTQTEELNQLYYNKGNFYLKLVSKCLALKKGKLLEKSILQVLL